MRFPNKFIITFFLLLTLPLSVLATYGVKQLFTRAESFTYEVIRNHQTTCEKPDWWNFVDIWVKDENGNPLPNVQIDYWSDYPQLIRNNPPADGILTTDSAGFARFDNRWPGCIGGQCADNQNHLLNFFFKIKNDRSDTAVEVSSGIYGDECPNPFCPGRTGVNVWGHWGYEIEFRRKVGSFTEKETAGDHAGQLQNNPAGAGCRFVDFYIPNQSYNPRRSTSSPTPTITPVAPSATLVPPTVTSVPSPTSVPSATPTVPSPTIQPSATVIPSSTIQPTSIPTLTPYPTNSPRLPKITPPAFPYPYFCPQTAQGNCPLKSAGDANCDGSINGSDYNLWKQQFDNWWPSTWTDNNANFNCVEGNSSTYFVDLVDFEIWRRNKN